jgi:carotenoid cleavage dioxygenase-like enzyme
LCIHGQTNKGLEIGFPEAWDGDSLQKEPCPSKNIPKWLNGYFFVQSCSAYGKPSDPLGKRMTHMFDGLGAVSSLKITDGNVEFSAKYYPSRLYKIWNFYERNMTKSSVAWPTFKSPYDVASSEMWKHITGDNSFPTSPSVDFWKIGNTVLGATEFVSVGMKFDVPSLSNFTQYPFKDTEPFFKYGANMFPLLMPVHERVENDGSLYAAVSAFDPRKNKMYQVIFRVNTDGTRTIEGTFEHETYDPSKCASDGSYTGNKKALASYMHSITSTKNYIVLPLTSIIVNPCKLPPIVDKLDLKEDEGLPEGVRRRVGAQELAYDVPVRFLIFDKIQKRFLTEEPIEADMASFITHQFNAYEEDDGTIVADMIGGEVFGEGEKNGYDILDVENVLGGGLPEEKLYRFRINLKSKSIKSSNILADHETMSVEFPCYNRDYMEMKYKFGYIVRFPYKAGSKIAKIDLDARKIVAEFSAPGSRGKDAVFREPWFVPKPGSKDEDEGVILALAGDISTKTTTLYVLDGKSLKMIGQSEIPTFIPLGFHNRFYSLSDLGLNKKKSDDYCHKDDDTC